ncbi:MAG: glycerol-3-phosphate 1-O-acyltransferase PlsY, partial [Planctomycetaceae bacterium]|nr:glycerol-3-phosphate 1-O-acyltransferase PlsY [Planctomycetaceae bacterium]
PFGLLIGKWFRGIDLRDFGSGNIGATNAARVLGKGYGAAVLLLDALKGLLPTWLLADLVAEQSLRAHVGVACGIAAIVGHMFPVWLGFRGGKGVATSLGVIAVIAPWGTLIAVAAFTLTFAAMRIVSASSIAAAVSLAVGQMILLRPSPFSAENWSVGTFSLLAPLLVIVRHRDNIRRLLRGEEPTMTPVSTEPSDVSTPIDAA